MAPLLPGDSEAMNMFQMIAVELSPLQSQPELLEYQQLGTRMNLLYFYFCLFKNIVDP